MESQELGTGLTGENQSSAQASDACSDRYFAPQIVMQVVAVVKDRFWISPKTAMPPKPRAGTSDAMSRQLRHCQVAVNPQLP